MKDISVRLAGIQTKIQRIMPTVGIQQKLEKETQSIVGLLVRAQEVTVKMERITI